MNQRYIDYATYNIWANNKIIDRLLQEEETIMEKEINSSFLTIRDTLKHIWFAETGWLSRLKNNDWKTEDVINFSGTSKELFSSWQKTSQSFKDFVEIEDLEKLVVFKSRGQDYSVPSREIAQTVFNHGTYHRGQVVVMMKQLGIEDIPQTDYIEWIRQKARKSNN